ncbi:Mpp10 protein-domain-containing protein [Apiosordaria backusii]|uniref:U3 small nucleolar ribonucleoprotein protein MPP10 n=1 Tax=Apiosordaria backusii TaxID=314023 RepID=A0AA39ZS01_9PEZI|nr:Mpp10 protein-domain-containing protein [Apiosordaria backusii]
MAGSTGSNSDLTSTSHTLTNLPVMSQNGVASGPSSAVALFLDSTAPANRHVFLQPYPALPNGSLQLAKETLDSLAGPVSDQQQQRLREAGKKRKRDGSSGQNAILKIRKLHIDGFETDQVWQQAKKIISSALQESTSVLEELEENNEIEQEGADVKALKFGKDGFEIGSDDDDDASASSEIDEGSEADTEDSDVETSSVGEEGESMFDLEAEDDDEDEEDDEDDDDEEMEDDEEEPEVGAAGEDDEDEEDYEADAAEDFVEDPNGLNDGFFSIDEFNKQTQWFEDQDARADPNTDYASDEEAVDWHGDPFAVKKSAKKGSKDEDSDMEMDMDDEEDDGPALTKKELADLAKFSDDEDEDEDEDDGQVGGADDMDLDLTANDIYYKDFFAPPAKKRKTGNQRKPYKPKQPFQPTEEDIERAQNDVKRDLFDDLSEFSDEEDALSDASAGNPKSRRSAHERRQAKIAEEIRKLESELVAKRAWTLSGEATAQARPINSLLEEDLDFEHAGKPVPVMTEDVSESIEELIKRRILANEFDEVLRRRPDDFGNPNRARRGLVDIEDTKGKQSLAEIYEEKHIKESNPDAYVSQADEKTRKDEEEIKQMWKDISARLDALSSWHYKPKPVAPTLTVVADVATVAMEDAQPTTAQGVAGGESMIAPQEVYAPGKDSVEKGEIVAKSGLPVAKQEMSREEKARRRRRDKERIRKAGGLDANKPVNKKAQAQKETMSDLKKGGVKVINKKGEVVGLDGKKIVEHKGPHTSGAFKL